MRITGSPVVAALAVAILAGGVAACSKESDAGGTAGATSGSAAGASGGTDASDSGGGLSGSDDGALRAAEAGGEDATSSSGCDLPYVTQADCATAHAMALSTTLPPARGNMYGDNPQAASLGFSLFFDANLAGGTSCATCHSPELTFTDRLDVSKGKSLGTRNAPTIWNVARLSVVFWDGRADSVWSQPLFPVENPVEMASTRIALAQYIAANYASQYTAVFGALPDMSTWPQSGKPGDPAYDSLPDDTKDQINRIAANFGKALEAYMRKNTTGAAPFDAFLGGSTTAMSDAAERGFGVFLANKCETCHSGPLFSDEAFHAEGFPSLADGAADEGQASGLPILQASIFNLAGAYADPGPGVPGTIPTGSGVVGAFRTPSLRNVMGTFPYGHDGALTDIPSVLQVHAPGLSQDDQNYLSVFFEALTGEDPGRPWDTWPSAQ